MSINRLFLYDPETKLATCIAKGYSDGWQTYGDSEYQNKFFNKVIEFTGGIKETRLQLKTEVDLPEEATIYWSDDWVTQDGKVEKAK